MVKLYPDTETILERFDVDPEKSLLLVEWCCGPYSILEIMGVKGNKVIYHLIGPELTNDEERIFTLIRQMVYEHDESYCYEAKSLWCQENMIDVNFDHLAVQ
jgi:hypothetical protein